MKKTYTRGLFIFRQDLRIFDNVGFRHAVNECKEVIPVFIFDTEILSQFPQQDKRIGFLIDALQYLQSELQKKGGDLCIEHGVVLESVKKLTKQFDIQAIYRNKSYGSNSLSRDQRLKERAAQHDVAWHEYKDFLLVEPEDIIPMKVFTPFYKRRMGKHKIISLREVYHIVTPQLPVLSRDKLTDELPYAPQTYRSPDGRKETLSEFDFPNYKQTRNFPGQSGTSMLSPYIRFGLVSIRQIFKEQIVRLGGHSFSEKTGISYHSENGYETITMHKDIFQDSFISELAWREFRQHIAHHFPDSRQTEFLEKRRNLAWANREEWFEARKNGTTGYPIVDAGMRQLKEHNRIHGRVRMIVASFLTKDLLIDRRRGEKHFADYLLDYDENVNIGNRQRSASVGADPKPLRIFNPILQSQKYDPHAQYIKQRLPELKDIAIEYLHNPLEHTLQYATPIVDHYVTSKLTKKMYNHEPYQLPACS